MNTTVFAQMLYRIAGNKQFGDMADGTSALKAPLHFVSSIKFGLDGFLYLTNNMMICKIDTTTNKIYKVAGTYINSTFSGDGGLALNAGFWPNDFVFDKAGNMFICDMYNHRIRKVDAQTHIITTIAGNGSKIFTNNSLADTTGLPYPNSIDIDKAGNLYIGGGDILNSNYYYIYKLDTTTKIINKIAGTGGYLFNGNNSNALQTGFSVSRVKILDNGDLYFASPNNGLILKLNTNTNIITIIAGVYNANVSPAYKGDGGLAINTNIYAPVNFDFNSSGNLLIVDEGFGIIHEVDTTTGIITLNAGIPRGINMPGFYGSDTAGAKCDILSIFGGHVDFSGIVASANNDYYVVTYGNSLINKYDHRVTIATNPDLKIALSDPAVCAEQTTKIRATISDSAIISADSLKGAWYINNLIVSDDSLILLSNKFKSNDSVYFLMSTINTACQSIILKSNTIKLTVNPKPVLNFPVDTIICSQQILNLDALQQDSSAMYLWQDGIVNAKRTISNSGKYSLSIKKENCVYLDSINIIYEQTPSNLSIDTSFCELTSIALNASFPYSTYLWQDNSNKENFVTNKTGTYYCTVKNFCGSGVDTFNVYKYCEIYVPNAFSPNADGINDTWSIKLLSNYQGTTIDVFNRYGQPVFHSVGYSKEWDGKYNGKDLPIGTYYYVIKLNTINKLFSGSITILR